MAEHVWQDYRLNSSTAARYYFPSTSTTYCENSAFVCQACAAERFFKSISTTGPARHEAAHAQRLLDRALQNVLQLLQRRRLLDLRMRACDTDPRVAPDSLQQKQARAPSKLGNVGGGRIAAQTGQVGVQHYDGTREGGLTSSESAEESVFTEALLPPFAFDHDDWTASASRKRHE
ncbi:hypothetical protein PR003_g25391 [Phytophthora rubi]|uniref:Uncharacterized protein n=1 Tax=Phytophthora rubi TaxID=129364 RepID=A0A6A4CGL5_9STRA|nr:hypothetical protein PR003_g25391 [Phytophthora rubi]